MRPIKCGFRSLKGSLFFESCTEYCWFCKQALKILFSRLQSSTDLFRSGKTKKRIISEKGHPTTVFCKISVRRSKNRLKLSIPCGRLRISTWPFHSFTIFKTYLKKFPMIFWRLIFRTSLSRLSFLSQKKET